jgi:hypothetical protein
MVIIPLKEYSRQPMATTSRQQFCGNTLNIFSHEDLNFQWSKAYSYYLSPPTQKDII